MRITPFSPGTPAFSICPQSLFRGRRFPKWRRLWIKKWSDFRKNLSETESWRRRRINWKLLLSSGRIPSSHRPCFWLGTRSLLAGEPWRTTFRRFEESPRKISGEWQHVALLKIIERWEFSFPCHPKKGNLCRKALL